MSQQSAFIPRLTLAIASLCFAPLSGHAADAITLKGVVDRAIQPLMAQYEVPGMAVAVTVGGKATFFNYGLASKQDGVPVSEHTLFELGSLSKTFTAALASYAQVAGKLSLDDHPGAYLPQLQGSPLDRATLLDLGAYAAGGLPLQVPDELTSDDRMLAWLRAFRPEAEPGVQRRYSNPSIGLFGRAAAIALQSDFSDALERQLFPALGLSSSFVHVPAAAMGHYAWGYKRNGQPARVNPGMFDAEAYGVKSSAADMIRFVQLNIDPGQLADPVRLALQGTQVGYFQIGDMVQGLGWEQYRAPVTLPRLLDGNSERMARESNPAAKLVPPQTAPAGTLFNKTGSTGGFGAYVLFVPAQRVGIVMLANKNFPNAARIEAAWRILTFLDTK